MRNTRKFLVALLVVFTLLVSMATLFVSADAPTTLYLTPNANWKADNARFAAYFFGNGEKWVSMTDANKDGVYEVEVPAGYPSVIFCRMNPNASANNWNNKWNQTSDLTVPTNGTNHYTVKEGTWDKGGGNWSTYGSTCAHTNLGDAATCTTDQVCKDCGDPVVSALGHSYDAAHVCTRCSVQASFTVAGTGAHLGTEWDTGNKANDMTYADGVYTKVYTNVAAGSYKFKVARDHDWGTAYPDADKSFTVDTAGSTVTITLKGTTVDVKVEAPHEHNFVEGKCECGETDPNYVPPHEHNFVEGKCECGETDPNYVPPHEHNFVEGKCECGETDPNYVPPHEHNFVEGKCECGEIDPDYVAPQPPVANDKLINFSEWAEFPKETYADGDTVKYNDIFTFIYGKNSRVDGSSKTWDDFSGTLRFSLGGKTNSGVPTKNAIQITVDGAHTLKIWYVAGGDARYFELRDADGNAIATTTAETVKNSQYYSELEIPAAGVYYLTIPADNNYIFQLELVAKAVEEPIDPPHVNTLVVGDTNKIVVNGETLNQYDLPIEWVAFVADEKAHYEFIGDNGALVYIFDASYNLLCGGTGKADLEAGTYLICVGNGLVGEFNVAVTKSAIPEPPVSEGWTFWISDGAPYIVDGYNIKYNGAGNTYGCVGTADVAALAVGNNTFVITITNNGSVASRVRVDLKGTNTVDGHNHNVCNISAVGGDVWTDMDWGGSIVTVPAGESVTLTITYDGEGQYGAVSNLIIFVDAMRGDSEIYSSDVTISDMAFSNVSDEPGPDVHKNALVVGDNKFIVTDEIIANYIEYITFVAEADGKYTFTASEGSNFVLFAYIDPWTESWAYTDPYVTNNGTGDNFVSVNLKAGLYIVGVNYFYGGTVAGEYNINVSVGEYEDGGNDVAHKNEVVLGENLYVLSESLKGIGFEFTTFTADKAGWYTFANQAPLTFFIWPDYPNVAVGNIPETAPYVWNVLPDSSGFEESITVYLEAGVYAVGFRFDFAEIGEYNYTISYSETDPNPHEHNFVEGKCECGETDPNYVPPHEHNFVEGKCECGESDPNYVPPTEEEPKEETPDEPAAPEQPAPKLNFFQRIWKAIVEFFQKIFKKKP